jgi:type III secretory pathway component EscV
LTGSISNPSGPSSGSGTGTGTGSGTGSGTGAGISTGTGIPAWIFAVVAVLLIAIGSALAVLYWRRRRQSQQDNGNAQTKSGGDGGVTIYPTPSSTGFGRVIPEDEENPKSVFLVLKPGNDGANHQQRETAEADAVAPHFNEKVSIIFFLLDLLDHTQTRLDKLMFFSPNINSFIIRLSKLQQSRQFPCFPILI